MSNDVETVTLYGDLATRWTIRVALLGYFLGAALRLGGHSLVKNRIARIAWTIGCLFYLAHVACAFQFVHHWSHGAAFERTAEQTAAVTGWNWGGGLYFNYIFTAVWLADVITLWLRPTLATNAGWLGQSLSDAPAPTTGASPGHNASWPTQTALGQTLPQPPMRMPPLRWLSFAVQAFLWFMVFNATVVFGSGIARWGGLIGYGWLLVLAVQRFARGGAGR